jgi:biopolymer transport protein ExbB
MIWTYIQAGGVIMYVLLLMNVVGFSVSFWKGLIFYTERNNIKIHGEDILNQILSKVTADTADETILMFAKEKVASFIHQFEKGMVLIKIIAAISPLLGLLGTALGVLNSFHSISMTGLKNPTVFAGGISMALVTTVGGLIVSIPHFMIHNYFNSWLTSYEIRVEDEVLEQYLAKKVGS